MGVGIADLGVSESKEEQWQAAMMRHECTDLATRQSSARDEENSP